MLKIKRKSLLYKSEVEYADFCINHVEGCAHGCRFPCYAMQMAKRFGKIKDYSDWTTPKLVENSLELLDKEIPKYQGEIKFVHLCFMTDPFMHRYKEVQNMTLKIINKLNKNRIKCTVLTKGIYPKLLANRQKFWPENEYGITLVSINEDFREKFEPNTATYKDRINALKNLHDQGLRTWVSIEPYPTPNLDKNQDLPELLDRIRFVDKIIFGKLNYNVVSSGFVENAGFYEKCASEVMEFCRKNNIECHVKCGTQRIYNKKTEIMFQKVCTPPICCE